MVHNVNGPAPLPFVNKHSPYWGLIIFLIFLTFCLKINKNLTSCNLYKSIIYYFVIPPAIKYFSFHKQKSNKEILLETLFKELESYLIISIIDKTLAVSKSQIPILKSEP